jgi:hypothetical protein
MKAGKLMHQRQTSGQDTRAGERGAALALSLILLALVGVIAASALAVVSHEARIAGSDLQHTQSFYAASAGIEKMTSDFSELLAHTIHPTQTQLNAIAADSPSELATEHFVFNQQLQPDAVALTAMRNTQGITNGSYPRVTIPSGPFAGLLASVSPYLLTSTATHTPTGTQVKLALNFNNYMIPLFQFGTFGDKDLEFWPQPPMTFNGRVHANGNIYFGGDITFLSKVTTANEAVYSVLRNDGALTYFNDPRWVINGTTVHMTQGSVTGGPNMTQPRTDGRGYFPDSPAGSDNASWKTTSVAAANGTANQFAGQLLTKSTGAAQLLLPLQLDGKEPRELIKRQMPDDTTTMQQSRFHSKSQIRILIDDENAGSGNANVAGIPANKGVYLSRATGVAGSFDPLPLDSGNALRVVNDNGAYVTTTDWLQGGTATGSRKAETVRGVRNYAVTATTADSTTGGFNATATELSSSNASVPKSPSGALIPPGAGISGHILIEVVDPNGATYDVTREILSMGMTVGEPNGIVYMQRPEWAAFMQGSRDRKGGNDYLTYFLDNSTGNRRALADGELSTLVFTGGFNAAGFISMIDNSLDDDAHSALTPFLPTIMRRDDKPGNNLNKIVPITVYNVREGRINEALDATVAYQRGVGSVIDINMRNLARWVDGVYDATLLRGTNAVSANIDGDDGYILYVSDRRGDRVKSEYNAGGAVIQTTNGMVDNEDVYGYNQANGNTPDPGEDVIDAGVDPATGRNKLGSLQIDQCELPSAPVALAMPASTPVPPTVVNAVDYTRAITIAEYPFTSTAGCSNPNWFRRGVRLFNGENLQITGGANKLSSTKGLTVSTENMVYIWGNYNTTGISVAPATGVSTLNDGGYTGAQVPAAIVADAFFPISKTWYDAMPSVYPEGSTARIADAGLASDASAIAVGQETAVRAGMIAGTTMSAMVGNAAPSYFLQWLNGGVHNYPRFLETWSVAGSWVKRWNYTGSYILLYQSTQAVGPYSVANSVVYSPPQRNWSFDITFTDPNRLPPGTPEFQYIEPTGFRETY